MGTVRETTSKAYHLTVEPDHYRLSRENVATTCSGAVLTIFAIIGLLFGISMLALGTMSTQWAALIVGIVVSVLAGWALGRTISGSERWMVNADSRKLEHIMESFGRVRSQRSWTIPENATILTSAGYRDILSVNIAWEGQRIQVMTTRDAEFVKENAHALADVLDVPVEDRTRFSLIRDNRER